MPIYSSWNIKPPFGTPINPSSPFAPGLACVWAFNEAGGTTVYNTGPSGHANDGTFIDTLTWAGGPNGTSLNFPVSGTRYITANTSVPVTGALQVTLFVVGNIPNSGVNYSFGQLATGGKRCAITCLAGVARFEFESGSASTATCTAPVGEMTMAGVYDSTFSGYAEIAGYINGVTQALTPDNNAPVQGAAIAGVGEPWFIGVDGSVGGVTTGRFDLMLVWINRALGAMEVATLHANPWQIFQPPPFCTFTVAIGDPIANHGIFSM